MRTGVLILLYVCGLLFCISCGSTKNVSYFQGAGSKIDYTVPVTPDTVEAPIQKNDILNITVSSLNKAASADFNSNDNVVKGYLVNTDGNIVMPTLGIIPAAGLTKKQLRDNITHTILNKGLLLEPIVEIRHLNFEVTVLGEVAHPTVITVPSEQITLVKALGLAGDLTIYGKRDNILLIREENGKRITRHININSIDFISSPYYNLKPNDLIYVEPNKSKIATSDKSLIVLPIILSGLSLLILSIGTFVN